MARDASKLDPDVRARFEVVEGSHGDSAVLDRALEGADALFWLVPPNAALTLEQAYLDFTRPVVEAARKHQVRRIVSVTALGRGTRWAHEAGLVSASIAMDDLLMSAGSGFRGMAMPSFMDNVARQAAAIREKGLFFGPIDGDVRLPATATSDMGVVGAQLLDDATWSGQEEVAVLGPEDLSNLEMAEIMSQVLGRSIRYQQIPYASFKQQFLDRGASESFAQGYVDMYRAKEEGMDAAGAKRAAIRTSTDFRTWVERVLKPVVLA
ncbi:uncharacterized protein YbjT (DUF2867 family) [Sphingomonas sp. BK580]|nr:uncharacterized protein YbjT (DUF2867 family) [Sphingomonas sp. BK580]